MRDSGSPETLPGDGGGTVIATIDEHPLHVLSVYVRNEDALVERIARRVVELLAETR